MVRSRSRYEIGFQSLLNKAPDATAGLSACRQRPSRLSISNAGCVSKLRFRQHRRQFVVESERVYHTNPASGEGTEGTNYDETVYGYDVRKRRNRTVTPAGMITRTEIGVRSLVTSVWIGITAFGGTANLSTAGAAAFRPDADAHGGSSR